MGAWPGKSPGAGWLSDVFLMDLLERSEGRLVGPAQGIL